MRHLIPNSVNRQLAVVTLLIGFPILFAAAQAADTRPTHGTVVTLPAEPSSADNPASTPTRGMTKARVRSTFGPPAHQRPAIGDPPITRWDYTAFSVFFERNRVLHSVVPGDRPSLRHRDELAAGS